MAAETNAAWLFDEFQDFGWSGSGEAESYHQTVFTDPAAERQLLLDLGLASGHTLIDFGCGTGAQTLEAARICRRVIAVDVSAAMLEHARGRAADLGLRNVEFVQKGFLTYRHRGEPVDFVLSRRALHHLPDFWKMQALVNVAAVLKPGGIFYLDDLVYSFEPADAAAAIERWIGSVAGDPPERFPRGFFEDHVRNEYSTYTWLLEAMLQRAGFEIQEAVYRDVKAYARYTCVRA